MVPLRRPDPVVLWPLPAADVPLGLKYGFRGTWGAVCRSWLSVGNSGRTASRADRGVSSLIGTLLMALLTVTMAVALSDFMTDAIPERSTRGSSWEIGASLDPGQARWDDGDEVVEVVHRGGPEMYEDETTIEVYIGSDQTTYGPGSQGSAFDDGSFSIGERWNRTHTIPPNTTVSVLLVVEDPRPHVVASAELRSGARDCSEDTSAPKVDALTQDPEDLNSSATGPVTVTATLADACSGVDTDKPPHLEHRYGSSGSFTDDGKMSLVSGTSFEGEIPAPTNGWESRENETLVYRIVEMADTEANNGTGDNHEDEIQPGTEAQGTLTYADENVVLFGSMENFTNLQNASDDGYAANLTEEATGSGSVTSEIYGTAHSSSGAQEAGNATGSPDDAHAVLPSAGDWISVTGYNTFEGSIQTVEIAFEGHVTSGTTSGAEDELRLFYEVSGNEGATDARYSVSELNVGSDGAPSYVNVTADRSWTWSDVSNLAVKAESLQQQQEDDVDFKIDALWTRVTYDDQAYNLTIKVNVTGLPSGSEHDLEIRYNTTGETFHLDIRNTSSASWVERGDALTATSPTNWSLALDADEVDNGTVHLRFRDGGADSTEKDTLALDHVRVRTT